MAKVGILLAIFCFLTACKQKPEVASKQEPEAPKYPELEYVFEQIIDHDVFKCSDYLVESLVFKRGSSVTTYSYQDFTILRRYKGVKEIRKTQKQDEILRTLRISANFFQGRPEETLSLFIICDATYSDSTPNWGLYDHIDQPFWFRFTRRSGKWVFKDVDYIGG
jgi:hypothetical protein